MKRTNSTKVWI